MDDMDVKSYRKNNYLCTAYCNPIHMTIPAIVIQELEKKSGLFLSDTTDAILYSLINQVKQETGELLSINTLKRLLGRVDAGNRQPRVATLNIIAHYLGRDCWTSLLIELSNGSSSFLPIDGELHVQDLTTGQIVSIAYLPDRELQFLYLGDSLFEVIKSQNSKLQTGDTGLISAFVPRFPLIVRDVKRQGQLISQCYTAGRVSGLISIALL